MLKDREAVGAAVASPCPSAEVAVCDGCGGRITDRYYLVTVDRQWHSACLKCCECKLALDSQVSCFVKDGNIYCKEDFYRYTTSRFIQNDQSKTAAMLSWDIFKENDIFVFLILVTL
jgi:hypothetical protein